MSWDSFIYFKCRVSEIWWEDQTFREEW